MEPIILLSVFFLMLLAIVIASSSQSSPKSYRTKQYEQYKRRNIARTRYGAEDIEADRRF